MHRCWRAGLYVFLRQYTTYITGVMKTVDEDVLTTCSSMAFLGVIQPEDAFGGRTAFILILLLF